LIFATLLGRWPQRCGLSSPVLQQRVCIFGPNGYRWTPAGIIAGGVRHRGDPAIGIDSRGGRLESATKTKFAVCVCVCVCVCVWRMFVPNFARLPRLCVFKRRTTTVCCCGHSSANKKRIAINYARPAGVVRWPQHTRQPRNSDVVLYAAE